MDWDFTLLTPSRDDPGQPYGLRRHLYFPSERLYYAVISTDFILRFTWLCRFMPGVTMPSRESGIFILNFLEAMRRWIWIFFRVEAEWSKSFSRCFCSLPYLVYITDVKISQTATTTVQLLMISSSANSKSRAGRGMNSSHSFYLLILIAGTTKKASLTMC